MTTQTPLVGRILGDAAETQAAAGSTSADATPMVADHVQVPSLSAGQGVILRAGNSLDFRSVANSSASTNLYIYPPSGAAFNGETADLPVDLPAGAAALFIFITSNKINVIV